MKKINTMKKALAIIMLTGALCACGNTEPAADTSETFGDDSSVTSAETTTTANDSSSAETETKVQDDSLDTSSVEEQSTANGDIVTEDVQKVSVRYYIGYNIATGDIIKDSIPCYTVEFSGDDLEKFKAQLPGLTKIDMDSLHNEEKHMMSHGFFDLYELNVNDDVYMFIGEEYGKERDNGYMFEFPAELMDIVERAAQEYNEENVYKYLTSEQMTVTDKDGNSSDVTDEEQLEKMQSIPYYALTIPEDSLEDESVAYIIDPHDGETMDIYFASVLGKLNHSDGTYEYVYIGGMEDYLDDIYKYTDSWRAEHGIEE